LRVHSVRAASKRAELEVGGNTLPLTPTLLGHVWYGSGADFSELNGSKSSQKYSRTSFLWQGGGGPDWSSPAASAGFCWLPLQAIASQSAVSPASIAGNVAGRTLVEKPMAIRYFALGRASNLAK
jgi:hypothetical protein